ncbi:DEAD/DEAH box helicase [Kribbella deserti]|uniref:DEAD/DEAH box helicase n=1 Tax=Kribbella deserti TaxID=1926257 RepID=A0ABV6QFZ9_9ACTN
MSQQDQTYIPADGDSAADRNKKPRHKKFQNQSYGERMAAAADFTAPAERSAPAARPATSDRQERSSERPARSAGSDRPARSYDRGDRNDRPAYDRNDRGDRPARSYDRTEGSASRSAGSDRPARSYDRNERPANSDRNERPARSFDRNDRSFDRNDRPARSNDRPPARSGDRPERSNDRPAYQQRTERPAGERSFDRGDRPQRSFDRNEGSSYRGRRDDRGDRGYDREDRGGSYARADRDERPVRTDVVEDLGTVDPDNKFAELGLAPRLVQRLAKEGITAPFPIQAATIPDALAGKDVLGRGQTGSGKTLGFGLPTLMRLAGGHTESRRPRAVILVPTRELAMQVHDALEPLAHVMNVSVKLIAGGLPYPKQIDALRRGVDLLIATPGRLIDLCEQGAADLGAVEVMVLDEADHMCDMGFMPAVTTLLDMTPATGQRLLFSATLDNDVDKIVRKYLKDPVTHQTDSAQAAVTTMEHHLLVIEPGHKQSLTAELASRDGKTIVFVRTKLGADRVATQLRDRGVMAAALHGGLTQGARNRTLDQFKDGSVPVLVATDVAARGIHVDDVGLIVQADPAADHKDYLHRAGRTARAGGKGSVVTLVLPHQRRGMMRLAESAGVETEPVRARPGDGLVTELTGGAKPSGFPVKLPEPKSAKRGPGGFKGGKRFGGGNRFDDRRGGGRGPSRSGGPRRESNRSSY